MKKTKSVYKRMLKDRKLFFLGYGALYITEMRRVKDLTRTPELKIKSKGLAKTWYKLFKKYNAISNKSKGIHTKDNVYTFRVPALSLYQLISTVKKLPEKQMDLDMRKRLTNLTYTKSSPVNKNRIKILKELRKNPLTTNELARRIEYNSGEQFRKHLESLQNLKLIRRTKLGKQQIINSLTKKGELFIDKFTSEVETIPSYSLYDECFTNKQLAADLMLIISELEMGGIMQRQPYLDMASYDFVKFIFDLCKKWKWTSNTKLSIRKNPKRQIRYSFYLNSNGIKEIYNLSGPCADVNKDREYKHIFLLSNPGGHRRIGETKEKVLRLVKNNINTSKQIAFRLDIGIQNIQRPLAKLVKEGKLTRIKEGTGYIYKIR